MSTKKLFTDRRWTDPPDVIITGHQEVPLESKLRALDFWLEMKLLSPEEYKVRKAELLAQQGDDK